MKSGEEIMIFLFKNNRIKVMSIEQIRKATGFYKKAEEINDDIQASLKLIIKLKSEQHSLSTIIPYEDNNKDILHYLQNIYKKMGYTATVTQNCADKNKLNFTIYW